MIIVCPITKVEAAAQAHRPRRMLSLVGSDDAVACLRNVSVNVFSQALENTAAQSTYFVRSKFQPLARHHGARRRGNWSWY